MNLERKKQPSNWPAHTFDKAMISVINQLTDIADIVYNVAVGRFESKSSSEINKLAADLFQRIAKRSPTSIIFLYLMNENRNFFSSSFNASQSLIGAMKEKLE